MALLSRRESHGKWKRLRRVRGQRMGVSTVGKPAASASSDWHLLGFAGPKKEAQEIKERLAEFLRRRLNLELSNEKTLITHARTEAARFLGYEIRIGHDDSKQTKDQRSINGKPILRMPRDVRMEWLNRFMRGGRTAHRPDLLNHSDYDIVTIYAVEFAGLVNYYALAVNVSRLNGLKYAMMQSLVKTLAAKHQMSCKKVYRRFGRREDGRTVIRVTVERKGKKPLIATFGNKPCRRCTEPLDIPDAAPRIHYRRVELLQRMLAEECEICGSDSHIEVHHIRKLSDLKKKRQGKERPAWVRQMIALSRKTLVVCRECHRKIHNGEYDGTKLTKL